MDKVDVVVAQRQRQVELSRVLDLYWPTQWKCGYLNGRRAGLSLGGKRVSRAVSE